MLIVYILLCIVLLYFILLLPRFCKKTECRKYLKTDFAHRGLHDKPNRVPENSLIAFKRAVEKGYGIEFDIHLSSDGEVFVMHDDSLLRTCGIDRNISDCCSEELAEYRLEGTEEKIPKFKELLELVDGKVPLLIEFKASGAKNAELCAKAEEYLSGYNGKYIIESFDPRVLIWYRKNRSDVIRGQLSCSFSDGAVKKILGFLLKNLMLNFVAKPDFISYDFSDRRNLSLQILKNIYRLPVFFWTIDKREDQKVCRQLGSAIIFERFEA